MFDRLMQRLRPYAEKDGRGYPDWAVRYLPILRRLRARNLEEALILELGANEIGFARFAQTSAIAVDISIEHLEAARKAQNVIPAVADLAALPFPDAGFDVCICVDTFEHLPPELRETAAREIVRVLRRDGTAVISFPSGQAAAEAEARVRAAYRRATGRTIPWLEEHARYGLPDADALFDCFHDLAGETHRVTRAGNASLASWEWMWQVLMCNWPGRGNALFQVVLRWLTPVLSRRHAEPCYRTMIWIEPKSRNTP